MLRSSIDLGTNTSLLLIAEGEGADGVFRVSSIREDHSTVVRLGEAVDFRRELQPAAMKRTMVCLEGYSARVRAAGLDPAHTVCVATSQARDARNGAAFFGDVESRTGFKFRILSGEEEARLTFLGALLPAMRASESVVIDIGGGSTEFIGEGGGQSLDVGSVRFTERHLKSDPVTDQEFWNAQAAIDEMLQPLLPWREELRGQPRLVGVAGTVTSLAAWHLGLPAFDSTKIDETVLTRGDVHRMVEELKWRTVKERCALPGMDAKRADVLLAGSLILWRGMEVLGFSECTVSTRGLRFGALSLN